jgi:hypothetical protein
VVTGEAELFAEDADGAFCRTAADVRDSSWLTLFGDSASVRSLWTGDADCSSSGVSWPLPSLTGPLLMALPIEFSLCDPACVVVRGARDARLLVVRVGAPLSLALFPEVPASDCLDVLEAGIGGGPMDVLLAAPTADRGFDDVDGARVIEGVPVLGVDAPDVAADASCFVGDFVGDYEVH